jgi:DHA1 family bicyclomycin/chloramphenicol resistance-like MFS transporter
MTNKRKFLTILILGLLTAVVPFSIDMYLPGFPEIARSLHTTVSKVALSLSSFFIGLAIGQLAYGPILDRFGRKMPLYAGLFLYCITSVGGSFAPSIEILIGLRFVQAIGACAASVAATAMVRDLFPASENARIFSFLILVLSASPMLAPTIGGYVTAWFGWQAIFLTLTGLIIVILLGAFFFLPEGKPADKEHSMNMLSVLRGYKAVLREGEFMVYSFSAAIGFGCLFTYIASSPGIFMGKYQLTQQQYGFLFAFIASGLIIAAQVNNLLLKRMSSEQIMIRVFVVQNLIGILLLATALMHIESFWLVISLLFCFLTPLGFVMPNASALAMRPFSHNAGSAAALLGFIQMGLGSVATVLIGALDIKTMLPMTLGLIFCSVLALGVLVGGRRHYGLETPRPSFLRRQES